MYKDSPRVDMWNTTAAVVAATLQQGKNYDEVKNFGFESETLKSFQIEFDTLYFLSFQNLTRCKVFNSKWCLSKSMKFSKKWDLHLAIGIETRFFERLFFFEKLSGWNFWFKICRVVKKSYQKLTRFSWIQNLTFCTFLISKTGKTKNLTQNQTLCKVFDSRADFLFLFRI